MNKELIIKDKEAEMRFSNKEFGVLKVSILVFKNPVKGRQNSVNWIPIYPQDAIEIINHLKQQFEL